MINQSKITKCRLLPPDNGVEGGDTRMEISDAWVVEEDDCELEFLRYQWGGVIPLFRIVRVNYTIF
jgi:hypothetical protein